HLDHLNPFPENLGEILNNVERILIPELNTGHLAAIIRFKYLKTSIGLNKIQGLPLKAFEVENKVLELLNGKEGK
ncbi:MAG: 2-oxoglutarate/2-oxoacid ferredoxin oxidoreductase subunit alpha, partial [Bacteroidota bacterium]|nr:2-oxoglutarate/2-oxoacid ferredoxin oxidoreductase subunit alpha [Bacteroidota bacterium]